MTWFVVVLGLVLLVFLHELGHFLVARAVGSRPRSFYIGFPPAIAKFERNGVEYGLGAIPLGGYVRIPGMNRPSGRDVEAAFSPALREAPQLTAPVRRVSRALDRDDFAAAREALPQLREDVAAASLTKLSLRSAQRSLRDVEEGTGPDAYWHQPTWKRIAIIAAGPLANVVVAFVIFFAVYLTGAPSSTPSTEVAVVSANTPAAAAGLQPGDRVVAVDGRVARTFDAVSRDIRSSRGRPITVTVRRGGRLVTLGPKPTIRSGDRWIWGFEPAARLVSYPAGRAATTAASDCWHVVSGTVSAIASIFGGHSRGQVTSVVGIARVSAAALKVSFNWYLQILGFVSMSLALLNLLPLLPLDGGHILFSLIEAVRRRALAREIYERVSVVGFALILLIWVIALSNDVSGGVPR
ncbi:MAG: RIP metalloprotease [Actinobacteria bacterium]|nr:RIP metalloprotease [Actinomycetota bacterium]MBV8562524.1 RIP metalloprotease [Actinomycetota bacterium]